MLLTAVFVEGVSLAASKATPHMALNGGLTVVVDVAVYAAVDTVVHAVVFAVGAVVVDVVKLVLAAVIVDDAEGVEAVDETVVEQLQNETRRPVDPSLRAYDLREKDLMAMAPRNMMNDALTGNSPAVVITSLLKGTTVASEGS